MYRAKYFEEILARLIPEEVFDFYDGPRFYSCRDVMGQMYVVYWVDETDESATWLYLRVSQERYTSLKQGVITIAFALSNPEEGYAFVVHTAPDGVSAVTEVARDKIDSEWLPPANERLAIKVRTLPERTASAVQAAKTGNRHVFDWAFQKTNNPYEMGCSKLGRLLEAIQHTVFAFACSHDRDIRRVPEEVKYKSEILVTGVFASSFGVRLQTKGADLFSNDETAIALKTLADLIDVVSVPDKLADELHRLNILGRSRFKHLIQVLIDTRVTVDVDWGSPSGINKQSKASYAELALALQRLEATDAATTRIVERSGRLVAADIERKSFKLEMDDGEEIKGKLAAGIAREQFEVPSLIKVELEETCIVDTLTDREKWTYVLQKASKIAP